MDFTLDAPEARAASPRRGPACAPAARAAAARRLARAAAGGDRPRQARPVVRSEGHVRGPTPSVLEARHDAATKLDLAKAYQEMGDVEGAREILRKCRTRRRPAKSRPNAARDSADPKTGMARVAENDPPPAFRAERPLPMRIALGLDTMAPGRLAVAAVGRACRTLERALAEIAATPVHTVAAGRRRAYATSQVVHSTPTRRAPTPPGCGVNALLPPEVAVLWAQPVAELFHARNKATARHHLRARAARRAARSRDASAGTIARSTSLPCRRGASTRRHHDFSTFGAAECRAKSPVKTLARATVEARRPRAIRQMLFSITIRNIIGALVRGRRQAAVRVDGRLVAARLYAGRRRSYDGSPLRRRLRRDVGPAADTSSGAAALRMNGAT
jgi:tRNA pseudouridine38-40 synthase